MCRIPCFLYREGEHFSLPSPLDSVRPNACAFVVRDESGVLRPHPLVFTEAARPEDAGVFLFPWDIGQYIDGGALEAISGCIASLPYLKGRERRHIVCDDGDATARFPLPVCLFKISATQNLADGAIAVPYTLPPHMFADSPAFDWNAVRYDTSFVGNVTNPVRRAVVVSVQRQAPALRSLIDFDDAPVSDGVHCFNTRIGEDPAKTAARQRLYRKSLRESLTVLCPPGIGPHSIRMYETMYLGRVPVLFGESAVYPLERLVDYDAFCLRIPNDSILETGSILKTWLDALGPEEVRNRCVLACKRWNAFFAPEKLLPLLVEEARLRFWE